MAILVNGNGNARVYAAQDADLIASITGNTTVRTSVGNKMAATAADASTISVADGVILTKEGRRIQLDAGQTDLFTIPTGSAGVTNYYIIGYKLTTNSDNVQVAETFVQLMASSTDTIPEGTFRGGDSEVYVSVARVEQDGVNLGTITALLPELETISEINNDLSELSNDLGDLTSLDTTDKSSIVNAINEVNSASYELGAGTHTIKVRDVAIGNNAGDTFICLTRYPVKSDLTNAVLGGTPTVTGVLADGTNVNINTPIPSIVGGWLQISCTLNASISGAKVGLLRFDGDVVLS